LEIRYNVDCDSGVMGSLDITKELIGALGETYYKEYCAQRGWAYTSLEQINKNSIHNDKLEFKLGFERILVKIPSEIQKEIIETAKPSNNKEENPSFVFDFLSCKAHESDDPRNLNDLKPIDFRWVEVKTGLSDLTPNQINMAMKVKIPLIRCRVNNVFLPPKEIGIYWDKVDYQYLLRFKNDSQR